MHPSRRCRTTVTFWTTVAPTLGPTDRTEEGANDARRHAVILVHQPASGTAPRHRRDRAGRARRAPSAPRDERLRTAHRDPGRPAGLRPPGHGALPRRPLASRRTGPTAASRARTRPLVARRV